MRSNLDRAATVPLVVRAAQVLFVVMSVPMLIGGIYFGFSAGEHSLAAPVFGSIFVMLSPTS
jgi:hypothetical protein